MLVLLNEPSLGNCIFPPSNLRATIFFNQVIYAVSFISCFSLLSNSVLLFVSLDADAFKTFIFPPVWTPEKKLQKLFTNEKAVD